MTRQRGGAKDEGEAMDAIAILRDQVATLRDQREDFQRQLADEFALRVQREMRIATLTDQLREVAVHLREIETDSRCRCEEAWTGRGLHAPECRIGIHEDAIFALHIVEAVKEGK